MKRALLLGGVAFTLLLTVMVAAAGATECEGIWHPVDGCVTVEMYDEWFGVENLSNTESLAFDGETVAAVYGLESDEVAPSERRSAFMGVEYPSFKEIVSSSGMTFVAL